jgi:hypothetical protein
MLYSYVELIQALYLEMMRTSRARKQMMRRLSKMQSLTVLNQMPLHLHTTILKMKCLKNKMSHLSGRYGTRLSGLFARNRILLAMDVMLVLQPFLNQQLP